MNSINTAFSSSYNTDLSSDQAQSNRPSHFIRVLTAAIKNDFPMDGDYTDATDEADNVAQMCLELAETCPKRVAELLMNDALFSAKAIHLICNAQAAQDRPTDVQALTRCLLHAGRKIDVNPDDLPEAVKTVLQDWKQDA